MSDLVIYALIVVVIAAFMFGGLALDKYAPRVSKVTFGAFSGICFVSAVGVLFGDLGARGADPYFRIKAVTGCVLAGAYLLRECLKVSVPAKKSDQPDKTPRDWMGEPLDRK